VGLRHTACGAIRSRVRRRLSDNAFVLQAHSDCKPSGCSTRARRLCTRGLWNCPPRQWADTRHGARVPGAARPSLTGA